MPGLFILLAEQESVQAQQGTEDVAAYDVYVDDYANYGDYFDCGGWH